MKLYSFPKNRTATTELVGKVVTAWAERHRRNTGAPHGVFVLDGARVSDAELGSPDALLPVLVFHAENLYRYGVRRQGFGASYPQDAEALLRRSVSLDRVERSISEILCFVVEAAEDARQYLPACVAAPGAVELRGLVRQFTHEMGVTGEPVIGPDAGAAIHRP